MVNETNKKVETPVVETPEVETPEAVTSEVETPEAVTPEAEIPEAITPEAEIPEAITPEVETPVVEVPKVETPVVETPKVETPVVEVPKVETPVVETPKVEKEVVLRNVLGEEVPKADYFYKGIVPAGFNGTCGKPVDREDLVNVFHKVFKPKDNILFYKQTDKEVYIVIIPIKYATTIGNFNDSLDGDFQKHAISFLSEGSVNVDTMRKKLDKINGFVNYSDR